MKHKKKRRSGQNDSENKSCVHTTVNNSQLTDADDADGDGLTAVDDVQNADRPEQRDAAVRDDTPEAAEPHQQVVV